MTRGPATGGCAVTRRDRRFAVQGAELPVVEYHPERVTQVPVLLIHENRGVLPSMHDVASALASHGHPVVMPDLLGRVGGTDPQRADTTTRVIPTATHVDDLVAVYDTMTPPVAVFGMCFGAEMGWRLITRRRPVLAALWYGIGPEPGDVGRIRTPVFAAYAEDDARVNDTVDDLCAALARTDVPFRLESFPGTVHAFGDHTRPERFRPVPAAMLWDETIAFLGGTCEPPG